MNVLDFVHEGWCDSQVLKSKSCNCIIGYPLEVIEELELENKKLRKKIEEMNKHEGQI